MPVVLPAGLLLPVGPEYVEFLGVLGYLPSVPEYLPSVPEYLSSVPRRFVLRALLAESEPHGLPEPLSPYVPVLPVGQVVPGRSVRR